MAVALVACSQTASAGSFTLCNGTATELRFAAIFDYGVVRTLLPNWSIHGWHRLRAGECSEVARGSTRQTGYLSVQRPARNGGWRLFQSAYNQGGTNQRARIATAHWFFCVGEERFERSSSTLEDHERCRPQEFLQLFNIMVHVLDPNTNYTLTLGP